MAKGLDLDSMFIIIEISRFYVKKDCGSIHLDHVSKRIDIMTTS